MAKNKYPSACLLLESCIQDYQRVQGNYDRIYEKLNMALAFTGIVLPLMFSYSDFSAAKSSLKDMNEMTALFVSIELVLQAFGLLLVLAASIYLLLLMRGREIPVFDSLAIRSEEIYRNKESAAAVWLIGAYTAALSELRPIVRKKQDAFDRGIMLTVIGIMLYAVSIFLIKIGF